MQGAQKLRGEVPEGLAPQGPHKKVEAQRRRWTFYEVIKFQLEKFRPSGMIKKSWGFLVV
jgi:hypothetical protein